MTEQEFLKQYHEYETQSLEAAQQEAVKVNIQAKGFTVEVMYFPNLGYCLMLSQAKREL